MNREQLIRKLKKQGCIFLRHGSKHDIYLNPETNLKQPIPRHKEIDERLVKHILKNLGITNI